MSCLRTAGMGSSRWRSGAGCESEKTVGGQCQPFDGFCVEKIDAALLVDAVQARRAVCIRRRISIEEWFRSHKQRWSCPLLFAPEAEVAGEAAAHSSSIHSTYSPYPWNHHIDCFSPYINFYNSGCVFPIILWIVLILNNSIFFAKQLKHDHSNTTFNRFFANSITIPHQGALFSTNHLHHHIHFSS